MHLPLTSHTRLRRTSTLILRTLPSPSHVLDTLHARLLSIHPSPDSALAAALSIPDLPEAFQARLLKMILEDGATWARALPLLFVDGTDDDAQGRRNEVEAVRCERRHACARRWCRVFGAMGDLDVVRGFVACLGVFDVAEWSRCEEIRKDAERVWNEWRD
ncbi:hypothetical protein HKX48_006021 [Thoreauomyces humboldtii]|nr:hypothetical protein HKX48_006021 [Thoreauomyces humboldtii]